ncbi:MAG: hypothetical protein ABW298_09920 [Candidatus Binatia bacterium]
MIERHQLPDGPQARKGVPQIRHVHVLLKRGETILAQYFPGILDELRAAGSNAIDMAGDTRWFHFGGWKPRFQSGMEFYCQSRPFLEWKIRGRVAATPGVEILEGAEARSFVTNASRSRVTGVMIARKSEAGREEAVAADLVVDASGRGSRTPAWLAALGFPEPEESVIKVDIGYATALVHPPATPARDWKALFVYMRPPGTRLGVIVPVENGMWMVTLVGWFGDHPPSDPAGFVDFARSLPTLELYEAIRDAEICSPIAIHKFPANRRRRYERLARFPEGLAVIGDALTSFNPIYGQGMTTAALGASTLEPLPATRAAEARRRPRPDRLLAALSEAPVARHRRAVDDGDRRGFSLRASRGPPSRLDPRAQLVYRSRLSARAPGRARVAEIPAGHASHETPGRALRAVRAAPGADAAELAVAAAHRSRAGSRGVSE